MNLTIVLLSKNDDEKLISFLESFRNASPKCQLLVMDYGRKRKLFNTFINEKEKIQIIHNQNKGIYTSINKSLELIKTDYYLVLGLDDQLELGLIDSLQKTLYETKVDLLFAGVTKANKNLLFLKTDKKTILNGPTGVFPSHTGGIAIRKKLHDQFGKYSLDFKVTADLFFISICLKGGSTSKLFKNYLCNVGSQGFSKKNELLAEYECFIIRNMLGASRIKSFLILIFRLSKRIIKKSLRFQ
tara:strand:- start:636 stop:1364 length:729 start_codon:yes stop_codon:yes gene_type:complete